jgi:hypothetical protein
VCILGDVRYESGKASRALKGESLSNRWKTLCGTTKTKVGSPYAGDYQREPWVHLPEDELLASKIQTDEERDAFWSDRERQHTVDQDHVSAMWHSIKEDIAEVLAREPQGGTMDDRATPEESALREAAEKAKREAELKARRDTKELLAGNKQRYQQQCVNSMRVADESRQLENAFLANSIVFMRHTTMQMTGMLPEAYEEEVRLVMSQLTKPPAEPPVQEHPTD